MKQSREGKKPNLEMKNEINLTLCIAGLKCGPVRASPGGRVEKIVAAGGYTQAYKYTSIVEVYDIASNTWATANSLPHSLYGAAIVEHQDSFIILGGRISEGYDIDLQYSKKIYKYNSDGEQWVEVPSTLNEGKELMTAIKVKSSFFKPC